VRLFVAIKTDRSVNAALKNVASSLRLFGNGAFCGEDLYHVTLAFIGESDRVQDIKAVLDGIKQAPFDISLSGIGNFGNTYYVGISHSVQLNALQKSVSDGLIKAGFNIEKRPFKPHITLARRYAPDMDPVVFVPSAVLRVEKVLIMQSVGGVYKTVYEKDLNA